MRGETPLSLSSQMQRSAYVDALCILKDAMDRDDGEHRRRRTHDTDERTVDR